MLDRIAGSIPGWLAWPLSAASTVAALAGAGFLFAAAVFGSIAWAVWGVTTFAIAGLLWYGADYAQST